MGLEARGLCVTYSSVSGKPVAALDNLDLKIEDGEVVTIIGPSGCGKSTLLHCFGGLQRPTSGTVTVDGKAVTEPDPKLAAFVFQEYTLLPWKTSVENAAIGLKFDGRKKHDYRAKGLEMLELVGLRDFADAFPRELSGGMQQRVAIARAMCMNPAIMLMDEPFGALDEQTRRHLGFEMARILTESERTVVLVTHSLDEAILWGDRIVVLSPRPGRLAHEIRVERPRPRALSFVRETGFAETRSELFSLLESFGAPPKEPQDRGDHNHRVEVPS